MIFASTLHIGVALAAVLLLAWGAGRLVRALRLGQPIRRPGRSDRLRLRLSLALDPKRRLYLLACDDREALLVAGPSGDTFLGWIGPAAPHEGAGA